nr:MAG: ORF1 [Torque teno midi virus]
MPFWWNRRKKYWGTRRYKYRTRNRYRKRRPRFFRHRHRRATRRRRRRRKTKVRRKKPFIKLLQWQPDAIRKCKIIGLDTLILGANGKQFRNYVTAMNEWTPPTVPTGGGFSTTKYSLAYLYEQFQLHNNIWTTSNSGYDLCRYTGCKIFFYRHPWASFVVTYQLMYPMTMTFEQYMETQPLQMLLTKRHIIIPSMQLKPRGKTYVKKKIRPPKQMVNKWFFQHTFAPKPLLLMKAAVCNLQQPFLGPMGENSGVTLKCLNIYTAYVNSNWGIHGTEKYEPNYKWQTENTEYKSKAGDTFKNFTLKAPNTGYSDGWFAKTLLQAYSVKYINGDAGQTPIYTVRYNPKQDDGIGNEVWLASISNSRYERPTTDKLLIARGQPLWLLLFGFSDFIIQYHSKVEIEKIYFLVIKTDYFQPKFKDEYLPKTYVVIDQSFINGLGPYNSAPTEFMLGHWYPTLQHQQASMSAIVTAGPYTYKPNTQQNNWELHYKYVFFFKWGGSQEGSKQITDPSKHTDWVAPDNFKQSIQIADPQRQIPETILHTWDYRRDFITHSALKRMQQHLTADSIIPTDSECHEPPKKKKFSCQLPHLQEEETKEISCLQALFEKPIFQESEAQEEESLRVLIQQQQQQQQLIKHNLIQLLNQLKAKQLELQLQTGLLE